MKKEMFAVLAAVALGAAGCVSDVTQSKPGSMPGYRDRIAAQYSQPAAKVFEAAKRAVNSYGNVVREGSLVVGTNEVFTLEGTINQSRIWMRVEPAKPATTTVTIQVRGAVGGTDLELARELKERIAFELTP
jgi:hypothetical protein